MPSNNDEATIARQRGCKQRLYSFLDSWFTLFPIWSTPYIIWFLLWLPYRIESLVLSSDDRVWFSVPELRFVFVAHLFFCATVLAAIIIEHFHSTGTWRRLAWMLVAMIFPPIGAPVAYFVSTVRRPRFDLKTLLLVMTLACVALGASAIRIAP
jgi:hypothetical protein